MKRLILPLLVVSVLFSCKKTEKKPVETTKTNVEKVSTSTSENHTSETKQEFKDKDGNLYTISYKFEKNQPIAIVTSKEFSVKLNQEQAWAKGAEYKTEGYSLVSKGDNVQFFVNDKEIILSLVK